MCFIQDPETIITARMLYYDQKVLPPFRGSSGNPFDSNRLLDYTLSVNFLVFVNLTRTLRAGAKALAATHRKGRPRKALRGII